MSTGPDLREVSARVEQLLAELGEQSDAHAQELAEELVRLLVEVYGQGLARIVELAGDEVVDRIAADDLVASLLVLHDLHPVDVTERVRQALDRVRPYLGSHAGGVELLGVDDEGVVRLRLEGSCDGCPSSAMTVKLAIERAISEVAPEVVRVDVDGMVAPPPPGPKLIPVESLRRRPGPEADWQVVAGLDALAAGGLRSVTVAGESVIVCRCGDSLLAYRDGCPACGSSLVDGVLAGDRLACPACATGYDVRRAGRGDDGTHLEPLPLLVEGGEVRIAMTAAVAS
ncbi:MAG TPA: NifU family protein [Planosporangium sp.]|nr:NifU family protein [Planosporangium sp.]